MAEGCTCLLLKLRGSDFPQKDNSYAEGWKADPFYTLRSQYSPPSDGYTGEHKDKAPYKSKKCKQDLDPQWRYMAIKIPLKIWITDDFDAYRAAEVGKAMGEKAAWLDLDVGDSDVYPRPDASKETDLPKKNYSGKHKTDAFLPSYRSETARMCFWRQRSLIC